ncbi:MULTISPECIES: hypothetical protein [unclassified Brevibacterium]|uniref:hypothetical protein n=1 Tax=unclassified Brevibacterium TaxID=2614124 RepID=UPI0008A4B2D2|nr:MULTISPECIES: hypothetical protein [unclassified Brevibacterium]OFL67224.1 hypothetical protein HMPREF2757_11010 [Brevibacterium sp. HMSC063G07]OFS26722.1 hypothetical protein HMPREF3162_04675 [Brevibacterium sp. HMSC07C04]
MREKPKTGTPKEQRLARSAAFAAVMALRHSAGSGDSLRLPDAGYSSPVRRIRASRTGTWARRQRS